MPLLALCVRLTWKLPVEGAAWTPTLVEVGVLPPIEGGTTMLEEKEERPWMCYNLVQFPPVSDIHAVHSRIVREYYYSSR